MHAYIHTSHALMIHPDGYILNPSAWDPAWLSYDYIGALWEFFTDNKKNGNGGFTLRSKKLLNAISDLAAKGIIQKFHPEDHIICRVHRELLEKEYGIVFAPDEVCRKFSIESYGNPHPVYTGQRSEEHTSELQSRENLVCRLLLEKTIDTYILCFIVLVLCLFILPSCMPPVVIFETF